MGRERKIYLLLFVIKLLPFSTQQFTNFTCFMLSQSRIRKKKIYRPKPASGFSVLILSRQSWLKNIYAERARLGAFGSFLALRAGFSAFSAAFRYWISVRTSLKMQRDEGEKSKRKVRNFNPSLGWTKLVLDGG